MAKKEETKVPHSGSMKRPASITEGFEYLKSERFEGKPRQEVTFTSEEFTANCPRTGQPDFNTVEIKYYSKKYFIESKALKFYLWSYRDEGAFCETLSAQIAQHVKEAIEPEWVEVTVFQNVRGGIALTCKTRL